MEAPFYVPHSVRTLLHRILGSHEGLVYCTRIRHPHPATRARNSITRQWSVQTVETQLDLHGLLPTFPMLGSLNLDGAWVCECKCSEWPDGGVASHRPQTQRPRDRDEGVASSVNSCVHIGSYNSCVHLVCTYYLRQLLLVRPSCSHAQRYTDHERTCSQDYPPGASQTRARRLRTITLRR